MDLGNDKLEDVVVGRAAALIIDNARLNNSKQEVGKRVPAPAEGGLRRAGRLKSSPVVPVAESCVRQCGKNCQVMSVRMKRAMRVRVLCY